MPRFHRTAREGSAEIFLALGTKWRSELWRPTPLALSWILGEARISRRGTRSAGKSSRLRHLNLQAAYLAHRRSSNTSGGSARSRRSQPGMPAPVTASRIAGPERASSNPSTSICSSPHLCGIGPDLRTPENRHNLYQPGFDAPWESSDCLGKASPLGRGEGTLPPQRLRDCSK